MPNLFLNLPLPAGNGAGAMVDTSALGRDRTITVQGSFTDPVTGRGPSITVQASVDGGVTFFAVPEGTFDSAAKKTVPVAAQFMRTFVQGFDPLIPLAANVDVASDDIGGRFAVLQVPAAAGVGATVDVSAFGTYNTVIVAGDFSGGLHIDISEDGIDFVECFTFARTGGLRSKDFVAQFMRVRRTNVSLQVPGTATAGVGAINDATMGALPDGSSPNCLIFQDGGPDTGPVVFNDWDALYTQLLVLRAASNNNGCYTIRIDVTFQASCVIAASPTIYDFDGVTLTGGEVGLGGVLDFAEGTRVINLRTVVKNLEVNNFNTIVALETLPAGALATILIDDSSTVQTVNGSTAAFWDCSAAVFVICKVNGFSRLGFFRHGAVLTGFPAGSTLILQAQDANPAQPPFGAGDNPLVITGDAGSFLATQIENTKVWQDFPSWAGTIFTPQTTGPAFLLPNPFELAPATASFAAFQGEDLNFDVSGGAIAQTLPAISAAAFGLKPSGAFLTASEHSGNPGLTLVPDAGDTIDGVATPFAVPGGGGVFLISDGVSNWKVISTFDPAQEASDNCLIFQEGGVETGPVIFNDFTALFAKLQAMRAAANGGGCYRIAFDASLAPAPGITTIPVNALGGAYDFTEVTFAGLGAGVRVDFADGATVDRLFRFENFIDVRNQNTLVPLCVVPNDALGIFIECNDNAGVETINGGTQPFYDVATNSVGFLSLRLFLGSRIGFGANGVVFGGTNVGDGFQLNSFLGAQIFDGNPVQPPLGGSGRPNMIQGAVGSLMSIQVENTKSIGITAGAAGTVFPSWLGTIFNPQITEPAAMSPNPFQAAAATASVTALLGESLRLDVSGGPIAQELPSISGAFFDLAAPGGFLVVVEVTGTTGLTITPAAGDTIRGAATALAVPGGGGILLQSDGLSNWEVVAGFDPTPGCLTVVGPFTFPAGGALAINDIAQVDVSGGIVPLTLPAITAFNSGCKIVVKKTAGGGTDFTLTPAGGDTIDGVAGAASFTGALISVTLVSDGVSNWMEV